MKQFLAAIFLISGTFHAIAQDENDWIAADTVRNKIKFGFSLGVNYSNAFSRQELPHSISFGNDVGFRLGLVMDVPISDKMIFSPKAEVSVNRSVVRISDIDNFTVTHKILPVSLDYMSHFVYKLGSGKRVPYVLAGPNIKVPVISRSETSTDFKTKADWAIDLGFGLNNQLSNLIFSPEIRYSFGLRNINTNPILQSLYFHNITLVFSFK